MFIRHYMYFCELHYSMSPWTAINGSHINIWSARFCLCVTSMLFVNMYVKSLNVSRYDATSSELQIDYTWTCIRAVFIYIVAPCWKRAFTACVKFSSKRSRINLLDWNDYPSSGVFVLLIHTQCWGWDWLCFFFARKCVQQHCIIKTNQVSANNRHARQSKWRVFSEHFIVFLRRTSYLKWI